MRRILFIIAMLASTLGATAQLKMRDITVLRVDPAVLQKYWYKYKGQERIDTIARHGKTDLFTGGWVYSFATKNEREAFLNRYVDPKFKTFMCNDNEVDPNTYVARGEIDVYGLAQVKAPDQAYFFVFSNAIDEIKGLSAQFDDGADGNGIGTDDHLTIFMGYENREMETVYKDAKMKIVIEQPSWGDEHYKYWNYLHRIDSMEADGNERIALFPICYEYETKSVFKAIPPVILDGYDFHNNQIKRMGYDYRKYDPLARFTIRDRHMKTGKSDTIRMRDVIGRKRRGKHYTITLRVMHLGFDNILEEEEIEVDDGREKLPLRFIEFQVDSIGINYLRYQKTGQRQEGSDFKETNLFFKVGKAKLDADDYEGLKGLEEARAFAYDIYTDENIFRPVFTIEGYASPEGNYQSNADLAKRRAEYLKNEILRMHPGHTSDFHLAEPRVQPWTVVADTLERRGFVEEATAVREICAATSDMNQQFARIRVLPNYDFINEKILPLLRIDRITATYVIKRVLTAEEVLESYMANKDKYTKGSGKDAYEYYHLFRHFKDDYAELEPLARTAYNRFRDDFKTDSTNRPWTLAAYHLARCLIHRKQYDENLLLPYLKYGLPMNFPVTWDPKIIPPSRYAGSKFNGSNPYNDEAVVLLQLDMLCSAGSYKAAKKLYINTMGFKQKYPTLGYFLDVFEKPQRILERPLRTAIANTSDWNKLVVYAACCGEKSVPERMTNVKEAARMLRDTVTFREDDPRVHYLNARLLFETLSEQDNLLTRLPGANTDSKFVRFFNDREMKKKGSLCNSLMKAFFIDETFLTEELMWDKYMPKGLFIAARNYWNSLKKKTELEFDDSNFCQRILLKKAKEANITE